MPDRLSIGLGRRIRLGQRPSLVSPVQVVSHLLDLLATWERRARERRKLAEMSDHMLKDLGISRSDALRESRKSIWRA
jgi:uncharacterized protein YjiS (DUF1127 family)